MLKIRVISAASLDEKVILLRKSDFIDIYIFCFCCILRVYLNLIHICEKFLKIQIRYNVYLDYGRVCNYMKMCIFVQCNNA